MVSRVEPRLAASLDFTRDRPEPVEGRGAPGQSRGPSRGVDAGTAHGVVVAVGLGEEAAPAGAADAAPAAAGASRSRIMRRCASNV